MDVPKDQITALLDHELYNSAQILGSFLVSSATVSLETSPQLKAENQILLGDALFREREFRRAIHTYKQALHYYKIIPKQSSTTSRSSLSNRSSSPNSFNISAINENEMEGIPSKARTLQMSLLMAKLYRSSRHTRLAISCYKECLRHCPFVIEAIIALAELGVAAKDVISLFSQRYVEAQCCIASNDYKGGLELFGELLQRFPNNVHILLEIARAEAIIGKNDEAIMNFEKEMVAYIRGLIPNLAQLRDMPVAFIQMYCRIAAHKFFFFCDPQRRGKSCIKKVLLSNCLQELMELHQESEEEVTDTEQAENWFSLMSAQRICDMFLALDKDMNGTLSKQELQEYADGTLTEIFIERVFDEHVRRGKIGGGNTREMDFESFLDFVLALENKDTPEGLTYLFRCLDLQGRGFLTTADIHSLFRDVHQKWIEGGNYELCIEDVRDEIWDMVKPADPLSITLADLLACKQGGTVASMLIDVRGFWAHDNRENLLQEEEEPEEE
ncbi:hypothetical protein NC651_021389 [Populus alba x Populus x berolinensis]|nr:hypothetical protein NC651_021389 [Populus alba x Populus x berolinensis]